ncbi:MAG: glycine cleavage system protein H [Desulfobacteraceae bacterium]|nr:glycine cleavage system protein H [Desulfobacteraceae bacterium]
MTKESREKRSRLGIGSSYRKGSREDLRSTGEIGMMLGGQVWMVKPDQKAETANPCVWMQSGVVDFKNCNNFGDCNTCKYDLGMNMKVEKGKQISWQDAMRMKPALQRVCRHSLTNRIAKRACAYDYQCSKCDFDQYFEEVWTPRAKNMPYEIQEVKGFAVPMDYHFHLGHAWARIESGGYIRIGLDDFALKLLGKADALDLPLMGKEFDQGSVGWGIKRKDNLADVLSPVGGVITEVNPKVRENPELANREPYGDGWLFMVRTNDIKGTMKKLITDTASLDWINTEVATLENMVENVAGPMATDGGHFQADIYGNLPDLGWKNLTNTFLKT